MDATPAEAPATESAPELTAKQLADAKAYGNAKLTCRVIDLVIDFSFLIAIAFLAAEPLDRWLTHSCGLQSAWLRLMSLFLLVAVLHELISLPLNFYSGYMLEHKFGLSRQSIVRWLCRSLLQHALVTVFGLLMVSGMFALIWYVGPWWWFVAAAAAFLVSVLLGQLVPVLVLPLFYKIERLEDADLLARFTSLTAGTTLSIQGVYRMQMSSETSKANAMLAGMGRTRRVILGDTLLDEFQEDEIAVVLAHEIGHHVFGHITKLVVLGAIMSILNFWLCDLALRWTSTQAVFSYAAVPVSVLPLLLLIITTLSFVASPLQNALSRHFERQCDWYALEQTQLVDAYRSAFTKLARLNKADPAPHRLEVFLTHDHPPINERLAMAERFRDQLPQA
ncbi:MAG TPA: hypothetical protein DCY79_09655 [Planctomycetaceae bacterium]|nr:hypothetical protein [Blastopirellula sp.]HAY80054.1 hypothetical protein [Planctomycetaceae bacterium]